MIFLDRPMRELRKTSISNIVLLLLLCGMVLMPFVNQAAGQVLADGPVTGNTTRAVQSATVVVDGRELFKVVGTSTFPANKRAKLISRKIIKLAQDPSFDPGTLEVKMVEGIAIIFAGDLRLAVVLKEDAQLEGDFSAEHLAKELYIKKIARAIENYRTERETDVLVWSFLGALARTVLLGVLLFFLFWVFKKTDQLLDKHFKRRIEELEAKSQQVVRSHQIWNALQKVMRLVRALVILAVVYLFLNFVMELFPWTRYISKTLLGFVVQPVHSMWLAFVAYLPSLFFLVILFFVFRYVLQLTYAFFQAVDNGQIKLIDFPTEWAWPTYRIVRILIIVLGVVIAYPYIPGSGTDAFKGISIFFGVLLSLGSSSFIANIIAGYTMTYRRAFKMGDRVKIGTDVGKVTDVRLLVTHLRSMKNEEIIIPNSKILNSEITNYSALAKKRGLILHTTVGIGYEVPWRQVEAMLLQAAKRTPGLKKDSRPFVLQTALGDFGITYELNVFCDNAERLAHIYTDLHRNIQDAFNEYGVAIMTPHYVGDTAEPKIVPKEQWYASPAKSQQKDKESEGANEKDSIE